VDRGKGGCQQTAAHKVNTSTHAVEAAELAEPRRVSRTIASIRPIALPRLGQYYGEKIGAVCWYLRDVGVAGSNPVTPTTDFLRIFPPRYSMGPSYESLWVPDWVPVFES
jgi:hypothetical protein